jgi:hypothetical protein
VCHTQKSRSFDRSVASSLARYGLQVSGYADSAAPPTGTGAGHAGVPVGSFQHGLLPDQANLHAHMLQGSRTSPQYAPRPRHGAGGSAQVVAAAAGALIGAIALLLFLRREVLGHKPAPAGGAGAAATTAKQPKQPRAAAVAAGKACSQQHNQTDAYHQGGYQQLCLHVGGDDGLDATVLTSPDDLAEVCSAYDQDTVF